MAVLRKNAPALAANDFFWRSCATAGLSGRPAFTPIGYETSPTGNPTGRFAVSACKLLKALIVRRVPDIPRIVQRYGLNHRGLAISFDYGV
tara:strand:+ start:5016 stop:5288 length:273 start_codon:yes stop_codon:yes gene_type:complete